MCITGRKNVVMGHVFKTLGLHYGFDSNFLNSGQLAKKKTRLLNFCLFFNKKKLTDTLSKNVVENELLVSFYVCRNE